MDILEKLKAFKIEFTLDDALIFLIILMICIFIIYLINKLVLKQSKNKIKIKMVTIGGVSVELECSDDVKKLANEVWIELATRKISLPFDEKNDVIVEVYDSWYKVFGEFREVLKKIPIEKNASIDKLVDIIMVTMNDNLRSHLTKYQARFRKWYEENKKLKKTPQEIQRKYPQYEELVIDLKKTNEKMIILTKELDQIRKVD